MKRFVFAVIVAMMSVAFVATAKNVPGLTLYTINPGYTYFILDGFTGSQEQRTRLDMLNPFLKTDSLRIFENANQEGQYVIILRQDEHLQLGNLGITLVPLPENQVLVVDSPASPPTKSNDHSLARWLVLIIVMLIILGIAVIAYRSVRFIEEERKKQTGRFLRAPRI